MGLEIFQNVHDIFKYFKVKYFIVHLYLQYLIFKKNSQIKPLARTDQIKDLGIL